MNIIWDFGGTLFDTFPVTIKVFREIFHNYGINLDEDYLKKLLKKSREFAFENIKEDFDIKINFDDFMNEYNSIESKYSFDQKPYIDAVNLCKLNLEKKGLNFIFSHRKKSKIIKLLEKNCMNDLFKDILTVENGLKRKPSSDGILFILEKYKLSRKDTFSIGDREIDICASHEAGIRAILFDPDRKNLKTEADITINDYKELVPNLII